MTARVWATAGSVVSAAASSACCWLPLLMMATGFSAAGAAAFFERFRLPFLVAAASLLAVGFYLNYRPAPQSCDADGKCSTPSPRLRKLNRGMLWFSTALVAAFALFPSYVGSIAGAEQPSVLESSETLVLGIRGMTCSGCEAGVEAALKALPGVRGVTASYGSEHAVIDVDPEGPPSEAAVSLAIGKIGYELTSVRARDARQPPSDSSTPPLSEAN